MRRASPGAYTAQRPVASTVMSAIQRANAVPSGLPGPMPDALWIAIGASTRPIAATMPPVTTGGISRSTQW